MSIFSSLLWKTFSPVTKIVCLRALYNFLNEVLIRYRGMCYAVLNFIYIYWITLWVEKEQVSRIYRWKMLLYSKAIEWDSRRVCLWGSLRVNQYSEDVSRMLIFKINFLIATIFMSSYFHSLLLLLFNSYHHNESFVRPLVLDINQTNWS